MRKNGYFEVRFNEDKTQAIANFHPAAPGGENVTAPELLHRLKAMGVTYGVRDQAILDAIHTSNDEHRVVANIVVAQGVPTQDGIDAKIRYTLPTEVLTKPLPKHPDVPEMVDWFHLMPEKIVAAGSELAVITPPQPGVPGKTLTWPIQYITPRPGKPALLNAGLNVRLCDEDTRLVAEQEGYVCLKGDTLVVHGFQQVTENVIGGDLMFRFGAIFHKSLREAHIEAQDFIAIQGAAVNCHLRSHGDIILGYAENTTIIATGNVYVFNGLKNCQVNTRRKVIAVHEATLAGGLICATEGVFARTLGTGDFVETRVEVGVDRFTNLRSEEIQQELVNCEENIKRIRQAIKPFTLLAAQSTMNEEKRELLQRLQKQLRSQEARIKELHSERRQLAITSKERVSGTVSVSGTAHPGLWITVGGAEKLLEEPAEAVQFCEATDRVVLMEPLAKAA